MGFIAVATSVGLIIASEERLDAALKLAQDSASDIALGAIFTKLSGSIGIGAVLTMVVGMESDSVAHNEAMAKTRMINDFIYENFSGVLSKYRYCAIGIGWPCTSWTYEAKDTKKYLEIYTKIESLVDNPYILEQTRPPSKEQSLQILRNLPDKDVPRLLME